MEIYERIGQLFNLDSETSLATAYTNYISQLRANQRILVEGGLYTPDQLDRRCDDVQAEINASGETGGLTMADMFHAWLNEVDEMDPDLNPEVELPEEFDDGRLVIPDATSDDDDNENE